MSTAPQRIVLVDGSSYLYRAFHALPPLSTSDGRPTGAVKGVIAMLKRLEKDYPDALVVVVFDAKGKTFRDELYEAYKAHRPPMPEELARQVEPIQAIVRALGFPVLVVEGVEADDVIGTLARRFAREGKEVVISTGDKDMAQLVDERITLVNTMTDTVLDRKGVIEKFGVPPERIPDYLALVGDSSDNIPGVPGIGDKTARVLLSHLDGLDAIYADLEAVRRLPVRGARTLPEKLARHREEAFLSRRLATIRTDLELPVSEDSLARRPPDREKLIQWFRDLEFKSWLEELLDEAQVGKAREGDYQVILEEAAFESWLERLRGASLIAFDTETTSLDYMEAELVGVSFAVEPGSAAYVPFGHRDPQAPRQLAREWVLDRLKPLLEDPARAFLGHNLKYDLNVLARAGIELAGVAHDTMLESYVLNSVASRHDLDSLALKYLGIATLSYEEVAGKGASQVSFDQVPIEKAAPYAAEDADIALRLHRALWPRLEAEPRLEALYRTIEIPLVPVLSRMERNGALVDIDQLARQSAELAERLEALAREAWKLAGREFNLASPKQLAEVLFTEQKLPVVKKTPTGAPSTDEEVLAELALDYSLPRVVLEYRSLAKLKSTYLDKLPRMVNRRTGRIHTSFNQTGTATGRLSSSDPNLQNIPVRTPEGRRIRQAFVAPPGCRILAADYSQIELRIMAHLSGDQGLIAAFRKGLDIHRATAAEVFATELERVTPEQRRAAKTINFGLIYGMSAFGLARQLGVGRREAQDYIDRYFERYPGVARFMEEIRQRAREQGYVETLFGRRLYLPDIRSSNSARRQAAERAAINAPMQGTAADIIKKAMIAIDARLREREWPVRMILQVHDELVFEVEEAAVEWVSPEIRRLMEEAALLEVPLVVEVGIGANWDEAH
ncbi:MAG: DNA polymerase I [Porticoccaceae bacterium]|nr:MAG: DNA polymerase I [Porticoccaceae bacterium]